MDGWSGESSIGLELEVLWFFFSSDENVPPFKLCWYWLWCYLL